MITRTLEISFHSAQETPPVAREDCAWFVVTVNNGGRLRRLCAYYLNKYLLTFYYGPCPNCPGEGNGCHSEDGDGCPTTGWFAMKADDDVGELFYPLVGEVVEWAEIPQPAP